MKISNTEVMEKTGLTPTKFYYMQKHHSRVCEYIKKGVIAEVMFPDFNFDEFQKKKKGNR